MDASASRYLSIGWPSILLIHRENPAEPDTSHHRQHPNQLPTVESSIWTSQPLDNISVVLFMAEALGLVASFIAIGHVLATLPEAIDALRSLANMKNDIAGLISEVCVPYYVPRNP